jgi:predicted dehydrogenase
MMSHGPESWHSSPDFYYKKGGGPMFDMGPYYLSALITLLGPVRRVTGSAQMSFRERTIGSKTRAGEKIEVEVPTHVVGVLDFSCGQVGTLVTSFDVWAHSMPRIEIYGSEGTLLVPDPNAFGGPVKIRSAGKKEWREVPLTHGFAKNSRGVGVADMALAIRENRPHRAGSDLAYHTLDIMHALHEASREGKHVELKSTCERPEAMKAI